MKAVKTKAQGIPSFAEYTKRKYAKKSMVAADPKIAAVLAEMPPALRAEYEGLQKLLASSDRDEVRSHHRLGLIVSKIIDGGSVYGEGAVKQLEATLGLNAKTLYRRAHVARTWPDVEIVEHMISAVNKHGRPVTWSHLEVLAGIDDEGERDSLLGLTISKSLSVRQLRSRISPRRVVASDRRAPSVVGSAVARTSQPEDLAPLLDVEASAPRHELLVWPLDPPVPLELPPALNTTGQAPEATGSGSASTSSVVQELEVVHAALRLTRERMESDLKLVLAGLGRAAAASNVIDFEEPDRALVGILTEVHKMGGAVSEVGFAVQRIRSGFFRREHADPTLSGSKGAPGAGVAGM